MKLSSPTQSSQGTTACGGTLKNTSDYPSSVYHGKRAYFCKQACLRAFEQDPDRFMAGEIEHPIKEKEET